MSHYKPYPVYKDSGVEWIGQVPEHWEMKRLRHVAYFTNSNVDKKEYEGQQAVSLCNYTDVYKNEFITDGMPFMKATASDSEINQFTLKQGDVLITKDSEDPKDIGIPALVTQDMPGVVCGYHLTIIRPMNMPTSRFVHRVLMSEPTKAHFFLEAPGITRYGLGQDAIGDLPVCLPPDEEQRLIADWIDRETTRIDTLIAKKTRFIELLKEKRQALITHAVTKGLDPNVKMKDSGVEWIGKVPEHWRVCSLGYVTRASTGGTPDRKVDSYWNGSIPWAKTGEIRYETITKTEEFITPDGLTNSAAFVAEPGTILMAMYGMGVTRGRVAMLGIPAAFNQACAAISCNVGVHNWYVYYCLYSAYRFIRDLGNEASQINLNLEIIGKIKIPVPPLNLQMEIAERLVAQLTKLDAIESKAQKTIDLLKERRSAFITAAVTGQIDLRGAA